MEPNSPAKNIDQYRKIINRKLPAFAKENVYIPRFGHKLTPWSNWKTGENPLWWRSYNKVKHERNEHFADANLKNVLNSISGLLVAVFYFYKLRFSKTKLIENKEITQVLIPESEFLRLDESYYYSHLIV